MKRKKFMKFGKKTDNGYKIIERKFKDNSVYFFIEITNTFDMQSFGIKFPESYIFEKSFKTYDESLECVIKLKEEDKKVTVLEEKIHTV